MQVLAELFDGQQVVVVCCVHIPSGTANHLRKSIPVSNTPVVPRRSESQLEPLEWGITDHDDSFFVLALLHGAPPLEVAFTFDPSDGVLALSRVEVLVAGVVGAGLTAQQFRSVPIGRAYELASTLIEEGRSPSRRSFPPTPDRQPPPDWVDAARVRKRGRNPIPEWHFAQVAERYVHHVRSTTGSAIDAVAEEFGCSSSTVSSSWLPRCRELKLLSPGTAGRAGGHLTARALELLEVHGSKGDQHGSR